MPTKTCKKCGWVMDLYDPTSRCPICKTKFEQGVCAICGEVKPYYRENRNVCKHCYDTVTRMPKDNLSMYNRRKDFYKEWLGWVSQVPKDYPTLTEEQWLSAVSHFGKCALCHNELIETRGYFVPFDKGGRYCDWNVIPVCFKCATSMKEEHFSHHRPEGLDDIVDYLEEKLHAAIGKSSGALFTNDDSVNDT